MLGLNKDFNPRFLRRYLDLHQQVTTSVSKYIEDVRSGNFPNDSESY
jgi:3-methyl-2-oxobutanoate hydroxymethyltransferase